MFPTVWKRGMGVTWGVVALSLTLSAAFADPPQKRAKPSPKSPYHSVQALKRKIQTLEAAAKAERPNKAEEKQKPGEREEEGGPEYLESYHFYLKQRAYPKDRVDWSAYPKALAHSILMPPARLGRTGGIGPAVLGGSWEFVGPKNLSTPVRIYNGLGPLNGRVNALAYSPQDANTYYMGAARGGFWRSRDRGVSWQCLSDRWESQEVTSIALHPTNPQILYVGTGDFHGFGNYPVGLMKSTNGGETWTNLGRNAFGRFTVSSIVLDPENPEIVTVTPGRGPDWWAHVWRSTDGGQTWSDVLPTDAAWSDLKVGALNATNNRRYYYAAGHYNGGQVWRSADRGATWTQLTTPMTNVNWYEQECVEIAPSPTQPDTVYLMTGFDRKIYRSTNAGASWTDITSGFPAGNASIGTQYNWSQYYYDAHLTCTRRPDRTGATSDVLYVGLIDLAQYRYNGTTWVWQSVGGPAYTDVSLLHNDQQTMTINPTNPNEALVGCDGGAYRLTYTPSNNTWAYTSLNAPGGITQFYKMDAHPTNPNILIGGTQDNATPYSDGNLNSWHNVVGGDGGYCIINPTNTDNQYGSAQFLFLLRTDDNWASATYITPSFGSGERVSFIAPFLLDPTNSNRLYAATNYLYRYDAAAETWSGRLGNRLLSVNSSVLSFAVAPSDGNRIYTGSDQGELWMTTDGGTTWTQINARGGNAGTISLPDRAITSLSVDPNNPDILMVGVSGTGTGHFWRCVNTRGGAARTWQNRSGAGVTALPDIPLNAIARDMDAPTTTFYVGTDVGVFRSTDTGGTWTNATGALNLPAVQVNDLKVVPATRTLYAATYARGIWKISLPVSVFSISGTISLNGISNNAYPLDFEFRPASGAVIKRVITPAANGAYTAANLPPGVYAVAVKGQKWLRNIATNVNIETGNRAGVAITLKAGDLNHDNIVDLFDLVILFAAYGATPPDNEWNELADLNADSIVDLFDLVLLFNNYGEEGEL